MIPREEERQTELEREKEKERGREREGCVPINLRLQFLSSLIEIN